MINYIKYLIINIFNIHANIFFSNTESVRDVQFSPHSPFTFSAVSDNGSVQLWDIRKTEKCVLQYTAHSGPVFACEWHPEMLWLATASRDKTIKVSLEKIIVISPVHPRNDKVSFGQSKIESISIVYL